MLLSQKRSLAITCLISLSMYIAVGGCGQKEKPQAKAEEKKPVLKADPKKFEAVYRAGKTLDTAITMGVNFQKYNELVQNLGTELSIMKDRIDLKNAAEVELGKKFGDAFAVYSDCLTLWKEQISDMQYDWFHGNIGYGTPLSDDSLPETKQRLGDYVYDPDLKVIVEKYKIPVFDVKVPYAKKKWKVIDGDSFKVIWNLAKEKMNEANQAFTQSL